jgi:glycosyltransferase involved in cell wall biosynthesis
VDSRTSAPSRRYVVVTPSRDEARYLEDTIRSVAQQTVPPTRWVIVDDGSQDDTPAVLDAAARVHPFIGVVRRLDRGERLVGPGVIEAFYAGLESVELDDYDYVCKLDADLELPPRYFETLIEAMEADPCLGTFSGKVFLRDPSGDVTQEVRGDEVSVGPSKFYRVACFRDIGGFERAVGWDGIDGHMCRAKGWNARSSDGPNLRILHRRHRGSSHRHVFAGRVREGRGRRYIGTSPLYFALSLAYRMFEWPIVIGAVCIGWGYLRAALSGDPVFGDEAYHRAKRSFERDVIFFGKRRALQRAEERARSARDGLAAEAISATSAGVGGSARP